MAPRARLPFVLTEQPWPDDPEESARLVEEAFRPLEEAPAPPPPAAPRTNGVPQTPPPPPEAPAAEDPYAIMKAFRESFAKPKPQYKELPPGSVEATFRSFEPSFPTKVWRGVKRAAATLPALLPAGGEPPFALDPSIERRKAQFAPLIERVASEEGLQTQLLHAMVERESQYNPRAVSKKGAQGLLQLMPDTQAEMGVTDPWDMEANLRGGARYLKKMLAQHGGDLRLALASYNTGPGAVAQYKGIPPFPETQQYVDFVMGRLQPAAVPPVVAAQPPVSAPMPFGEPPPGMPMMRDTRLAPPLPPAESVAEIPQAPPTFPTSGQTLFGQPTPAPAMMLQEGQLVPNPDYRPLTPEEGGFGATSLLPTPPATPEERAAMSPIGKAFSSLGAGAGDLLKTIGIVGRWLGGDETARLYEQAGKTIAERYGIPQPEFSFEQLVTLDPYLTTLPRTAVSSMALLPVAFLGGYAGMGAAAGVGLGALWQTIFGIVGGAGLSRVVESAMEAADAYEEVQQKGATEADAIRAAQRTFWANLPLATMDAGEIALLIFPWLRRAPRSVRSQIGRALKASLSVGASVSMEGVEEIIQRGIQQWAQDEPLTFDASMKEAFTMGALNALLMRTGGAGLRHLRDRFQGGLPRELQDVYRTAYLTALREGRTDDEARTAGMDAVAQTPSGQQYLATQVEDMRRTAEAAYVQTRQTPATAPAPIMPSGLPTLTPAEQQAAEEAYRAATQPAPEGTPPALPEAAPPVLPTPDPTPLPPLDIPALLAEAQQVFPNDPATQGQYLVAAGVPLADAERVVQEATAPGVPTAPPTVPEPLPVTPPITAFTTSQGSTYAVDEAGRTTRTKTPHRGHLPTDVGPQEPSQATVYVTPDQAQAIGMHGTLNAEAHPTVTVEGDQLVLTNRYGVREGVPYANVQRTTIPIARTPAVGLNPIEIWSPTRWHAGNTITDVSTSLPPAPPVLPAPPAAAVLPPVAAPALTANESPLTIGDTVSVGNQGRPIIGTLTGFPFPGGAGVQLQGEEISRVYFLRDITPVAPITVPPPTLPETSPVAPPTIALTTLAFTSGPGFPVEPSREQGLRQPYAPFPAPPGMGGVAVPPTTPEREVTRAEVAPEPTPPQMEAGNYKKGHFWWQGFEVSIETARGGVRRAVDGSWEVPDFPADYGYLRRTEGADAEQLDVYIGETLDAPTVWVIDQVDAGTKHFDEHKAMIGFTSREEALSTYRRGFSDGRADARIGGVTEMPVEEFKRWVRDGDTTKALAPRAATTPAPSAPPTSPTPDVMTFGTAQDPLYAEVIAALRAEGPVEISPGTLQRRMHIGYTRAARLLAVARQQLYEEQAPPLHPPTIEPPQEAAPVPVPEAPPTLETPPAAPPSSFTGLSHQEIVQALREARQFVEEIRPDQWTPAQREQATQLLTTLDRIRADQLSVTGWRGKRALTETLTRSLALTVPTVPPTMEEPFRPTPRPPVDLVGERQIRVAAFPGHWRQALTPLAGVTYPMTPEQAWTFVQDDFAIGRTPAIVRDDLETMGFPSDVARTIADLGYQGHILGVTAEAIAAPPPMPTTAALPVQAATAAATSPETMGQTRFATGDRVRMIDEDRGGEVLTASDAAMQFLNVQMDDGEYLRDVNAGWFRHDTPSAVSATPVVPAVSTLLARSDTDIEAIIEAALMVEPPTPEMSPPAPPPAAAALTHPLAEGTRVVLASDGRHGTITTVQSYTMVPVFGGKPGESTVIYEVRTDNGVTRSAGARDVTLETAPPTVVIPDPVVDGRPMDPKSLASTVTGERRRAEQNRAAAGRARLPERKRALHRAAEEAQKSHVQHKQILDRWTAQYPEEAARLGIAVPTTPPVLPTQPQGQPATSRPERIQVSFARKPPATALTRLKEAGFKWNGREKLWEAPHTDIRAGIARALAIQHSGQDNLVGVPTVTAPAPPTLPAVAAPSTEAVPTVPPAPPTAPDLLAKAQAEGFTYTPEQLAAMQALLGPPSTVEEEGAPYGAWRTGVDPGKYAQLEPFFRQGLADVTNQGGTDVDFLQKIARVFGRPIIPYVLQFRDHLREESHHEPTTPPTESLSPGYEPAATPDVPDAGGIGAPGTAGAADQGTLAPISPETLPGTEPAGPAGQDGVSTGAPDTGEVLAPPAGAEAPVGPGLGTRPRRGVSPRRRGRTTAGGRSGPTRTDGKRGVDYRITTPDTLIPGGGKQRYLRNVAAIRVLKMVESEQRLATPAEQHLLALYSGWGATSVQRVFDPANEHEWFTSDWKNEYRELKDLLTDEEYRSARASTPNAHYTSYEVIEALYKAVHRFGFEHGRILEPALGVGNFFGVMPQQMRADSRLTGIELDDISSRIARQLYQSADIRHGPFEEATLAQNFYDLAVSNVPFGNYKVADPAYNRYNLSIHNYFFAKALDYVKPGGLVALITSPYTMDAVDSSARQLFATKASLVGAIRLPAGTFQRVADTQTPTDILFFQKSGPGIAPSTETFHALMHLKDSGIPVNEYFARHPEMMLGTMQRIRGMHAQDEPTLIAPEGQDLRQALSEAVARLPRNLVQQDARQPARQEPETTLADTFAAGESGLLNGAYTVRGDPFTGDVYQRHGDEFVRVTGLSAKTLGRLRGMANLRDTVRQALALQYHNAAESEIANALHNLDLMYDAFVREHGFLSGPGYANRRAFHADPDLPLLLSLENYDSVTQTATKMPIFTQRTIQATVKPGHVETPADALTTSLMYNGRIDWQDMAQLAGMPMDALQQSLIGQVFLNPNGGGWETAAQYLSGDVRTKLLDAEAAAQTDPFFEANRAALEAVQPPRISISDVQLRMGAPWVPPSTYEAFLSETLAIPSRAMTVSYNPPLAKWEVSVSRQAPSVANTETWGLGRWNGHQLAEALMNMAQPTIRKPDPSDPEGKRTLVDAQATLALRDKMQRLGLAFQEWVLTNPTIAEPLEELYNQTMNRYVAPEYDGSHLTLPGFSPAFTARPHQKNAIWRGLQEGNVYLAHSVGSGKTLTLAATAMELRRTGQARKPLILVPNNLITQWPAEFLKFYPAARILAASQRDLDADARQQFFGRIATGNWDSVILPYSSFGFIPVSDELFNRFLQKEIDTLEMFLRQYREQYGKNAASVKDLEKAKKRLVAKLKTKRDIARQDKLLTWEELGVDALAIDEFHNFKNLFLTTKMTRIAGISTSDAKRAFDVFTKIRYIHELTNGRNIFVASGTPISNTIQEAYTIQRYLQPGVLEDLGSEHFDAWANNFGDLRTRMEIAPTGKGFKARTTFSKLRNAQSLLHAMQQVMDVQTADMLALPTPALAGGKPELVAVPASPELTAYVETLLERAANLKNVDPTEDNMLKITSDGRKAAVDIRLALPGAPEPQVTKLKEVALRVAKIYHDTAAQRATQLVFLDMGVPIASEVTEEATSTQEHEAAAEALAGGVEEERLRTSLYADLKKKLIAAGLDPGEIAFIHEANTDARRISLFQRMKSGQVRVLIGNTPRMAEGVNVQDRLIALHHVDPPWKPAHIEQREGRILRQGNMHPEVQIYRYVTEGSFDAYMWTTIERKLLAFGQFLAGKTQANEVEDLGDATLQSAGEAAAAASGNPLIMEAQQLGMEIERMQAVRTQAAAEQQRAWRELTSDLPSRQQQASTRLVGMEALHTRYEAGKAANEFPMTLFGTTYTDPALAGEKLLAYAIDLKRRTVATPDHEVGHYYGKPIIVGNLGPWKSWVKKEGAKEGIWVAEPRNTSYEYLGQLLEISAQAPDPATTALRFNTPLERLPQDIQHQQAFLAELAQRHTDLEATLGKPLPYTDELATAQARRDEILRTTNLDQPGPDDQVIDENEDSEELESPGYRPGVEEEAAPYAPGPIAEPPTLYGAPSPQEAPGIVPPVFFSQAIRVLDELLPERTTPGQVRQVLKRAAGRGVKQEELKWLGLEEWLQRQPHHLTKQQVMDWLRNNQVQVTWKVLGEQQPVEWVQSQSDPPRWFAHVATERPGRHTQDYHIEQLPNLHFALSVPGGTRYEFPNFVAAQRHAEEAIENYDISHGYIVPTRYAGGSLSLPGAEPGSDREVVFTLPDVSGFPVAIADWFAQKYGRPMRPGVDDAYARASYQKYKTETVARPPWLPKKPFTADRTHYGDFPNAIAWLRMNDRTGPQGERLLHIEETQTKWGMEGRKKGFALTKEAREAKRADLKAQIETVRAQWQAARGDEQQRSLLSEQHARLGDELLEFMAREAQAVPSAPFITTSDWYQPALKWALRYAAEHGYDGLTWTTGRQQQERYGLRKVADELVFVRHPNPQPGDNIGSLYAYKDGREVHSMDIDSEQHLAETIGRANATRLLAAPSERQSNTNYAGPPDAGFAYRLTGEQFEYGGEWAEALYDRTIPNWLNKYAQANKWGTKTGVTQIDTGPAQDYDPEGRHPDEHILAPVHVLRITDTMRQQVVTEGQQLFEPPAAYVARFAQSKVVDAQGRLKPVYHGTLVSFHDFRPETIGTENEIAGFYFTTDPSVAAMYADPNRREPPPPAAQPNIRPVYLNIQRPFVFSEAVDPRLLSALPAAQRDGIDTNQDLFFALDLPSAITMQTLLQQHGYDGVFTGADWGDTIIAFTPDQILPTYSPEVTYAQRPDGTPGTQWLAEQALDDLTRTAHGALSSARGGVVARQPARRGAAGTTVLYSRLPSDEYLDKLRKTGRAAFVGQQATTPYDIAVLGYATRDPRVETLEIIAGKGTTVLNTWAVSSRLPASSASFLTPRGAGADSEARAIYALERWLKRQGAEWFYLKHNHPGTKTTPSGVDIATTRKFAEKLPGFRGHVVINHDEYSVIDAQGKATTYHRDDVGPDPFIPDTSMRLPIRSNDDVVKLAKGLEVGNQVVGFFRDQAGYVRAILTLPQALLTQTTPATGQRETPFEEWLRGQQRAVGAKQLLLYQQHLEPAVDRAARHWMTRGLVLDRITPTSSLQAELPTLYGSQRVERAPGGYRVAEEPTPVPLTDRMVETIRQMLASGQTTPEALEQQGTFTRYPGLRARLGIPGAVPAAGAVILPSPAPPSGAAPPVAPPTGPPLSGMPPPPSVPIGPVPPSIGGTPPTGLPPAAPPSMAPPVPPDAIGDAIGAMIARPRGHFALPSWADVGYAMHKVYSWVVQEYHWINRLDTAAERATGSLLPADKSPRVLAASLKAVASKGKIFLMDGVLDYNTLALVPGSKSLSAVLGPLVGNQWQAWEAYAIGRRAQERLAMTEAEYALLRPNAANVPQEVARYRRVGEKLLDRVSDILGTPLAPADLDRYLAQVDATKPTFAPVFSDFQVWNHGRLAYVRDAQVFSPQTYQNIIEMNQSYIGFQRLMDDIDQAMQQTGRGTTIGRALRAVHGIKGSERDILSPLVSTIRDTYRLINVAERAATGRAVIEAIEMLPPDAQAEWGIPYKRNIVSITTMIGELKQQLEAAGITVPDTTLHEMLVLFRPDKMLPPDVVTIWRNGQREYWHLNHDLAIAMQHLDRLTLPMWAQYAMAIPQFITQLKRTAILLAPEYSLRNIFRDNITLTMQTGQLPFKGFLQNLWQVASRGERYAGWEASGGTMGTLADVTFPEAEKRLRAVLRGETTALTSTLRHPTTIIAHPWQTVHLLMELSEVPTRLGAYQYRMAHPLPSDITPRAKQLRAGYESKESTVNFSQGGPATMITGMLTAFQRPQIAGVDTMIRSMLNHPWRAAILGATYLFLTAALRAWNEDEEPYLIEKIADPVSGQPITTTTSRKEVYARIPMWQKIWAHNIITQNPDGTPHVWPLPKAHEWAFLFSTLFEIGVLDRLYERHPEVGRRVGQASEQVLMPNLIPDVALPALENWGNYSFWRNRKIVPRGMEDTIIAPLQYTAHTSEVAKRLGRILNYPPVKIDHALQIGGLMRTGIQGFDALLRLVGEAPTPTVPERSWADWPLLRAFSARYPSADAESIQHFYRFYNEAHRVHSSLTHFSKTNDLEAFVYAYNFNPTAAILSPFAEKLAKDLTAFHQHQQQVRRSALSPRDMREALDRDTLSMIYRTQQFMDGVMTFEQDHKERGVDLHIDPQQIPQLSPSWHQWRQQSFGTQQSVAPPLLPTGTTP